MAHNHEVTDKGVHFVINPETRAITTETSKLYLAQYDHNSEKYTFKIPRFVEGHDMSECDMIAIDFDNTTRRKNATNSGEYLVQDIVAEDDCVLFTWLVSQDATQLVGYLTFSVAFRCYDEDKNIVYEWGTDTFKSITVIQKSRHSQTIIEKHPDLIAQLRDGCYYTPILKQTDSDTITVSFDASEDCMPVIDDLEITLPAGPRGEKGDTGDTGSQGPKGDKGDTGPQGPKGDKGDTGEVGPAGEKGEKGDKGDTGPTGPQGPKGDAGEAGLAGADGYTPLKGVDYYTEADKTEMVNTVLSALPTWTGGSY